MIRLIPLLALAACHADSSPKAQPPKSMLESADSTLGVAARIMATLPAGDPAIRLEAASRALLGRPYLLGNLGEGDSSKGEAKPRLRMDVFDCVTYLETSLAMAISNDTTALLPHMDSIRYLGGTVRWGSRNHFFEGEWLPRNRRWAKPVEFPGDTTEMRLLARQGFYAKHGETVSDTTIPLRMVPRAKAIERWSKPSDTTRIRGMGLIGRVEGFPMLHTAFLVERKGEPALIRHASQAGTVREQPFSDYLREKRKFVGVVVWEWFP